MILFLYLFRGAVFYFHFAQPKRKKSTNGRRCERIYNIFFFVVSVLVFLAVPEEIQEKMKIKTRNMVEMIFLFKDNVSRLLRTHETNKNVLHFLTTAEK